MFFILNILALIFITTSCTFLPHPMPLSQSYLEISLKVTSVWPKVLSIAIWFSFRILSFIEISICEFLGTLSVFQALFEVPLISVVVYPDMYSITICFSHPPFPDITISFHSFPHSRPMFQSIHPFSFVKLSVWPGIFPYTFRSAIDIVPMIETLIRE